VPPAYGICEKMVVDNLWVRIAEREGLLRVKGKKESKAFSGGGAWV